MAQSLIQRSFAGGEIAVALYARADQVKYQSGLRTCRNFQVQRHGGVSNRSGTKFINEVKDSSARTYFIKFVFNDDQTYVIEVGNQYMRFYRAGARIVVSGVAAYSGATAYVPGNLVESGGVNYYCIANTTGNAPPNATYWYALTGTIFEIPTPYASADLAKLQFVQSGDVVTITHTSYAVRELTRTGHTAWTLTAATFAPSISAPGSLTATRGAAGSVIYSYQVTAVKSETYEESLASSTASTLVAAVPTAAAPNVLDWADVSGAVEYNVYRETAPGSGVFGFIGVAAQSSFNDSGLDVDPSTTPPIARNPFGSSSNYPRTSSYYQQRQVMASTLNNPEKFWATRTAMFKNFSISSPLQDDDAVTFTMAGRRVNEIRYLIEVGELVILTASGVWLCLGDSPLVAGQPPNLRQIAYNGAAEVPPAIVGSSLIYTQARANIIRDLRNEVSSGGGATSYTGRDLTVYAPHLFKQKTVERMDYAEIPHSIVWVVMSDGGLLGLTYLRDHEVWGWHKHDTDGSFEDVCVVPEGAEDAVYVIVKRTINGATKRYVERFSSREYTDIAVDATFMDSFLSYDGRNTSATTLSLSTGAGWTIDDTITITAAAGTPFVAGDVGNEFWLYVGDDMVRISVTGFTDTTHVTGTPSKTVPASLRGVATTTWTRAVDEFAGAGHLEAKSISVFADGNVVANPNNSEYTAITVSSATFTTVECHGVLHAGLPYLSDMETLDLDVQGTQIRDKQKNVTHISLYVESSRGIFAGPDEDHLEERTPTSISEYDDTWPEDTELVEVDLKSTWENTGRVLVRQKDPLPLTILAAIPTGTLGG